MNGLRQTQKLDAKQQRGNRRRAADELDVQFSLPRGVTREVARERCLRALAQVVEGEAQ